MSGAATKMPRQKRNDMAVKIDAEIARKVKMICVKRDQTVASYLSELLKAPVERDFERFKKEIGACDKAKD